MKLIYEQTKEARRIYNIVEYNDGYLQILIMGQDGQIFAKTDEFPPHELKNQFHVFFGTELIERELENTQPVFELIEGGKE